MKHLTLRGVPFDRGVEQGRAWRNEILKLAEIRKELLVPFFDGNDRLLKLVDAHIKVLQKDVELYDEFRGVSEAAGISEDDLMILNNYTDLRDFAGLEADDDLLECSCFAVKVGGGIVGGQTWDMHASAQPFVSHLTVEKVGLTQEIFTLTGCAGLAGVNSWGLGVFINNLRSNEVRVGLAWPMLIRKILDQKDIPSAVEIIKTNMPSGGRNFLLVTKTEAQSLEVTGKNVHHYGDMKNDFLVHTNHYLSPLTATEDEKSRSKTSFDRYQHMLGEIPQMLTGAQDWMGFSNLLLAGEKSEVISIAMNTENPHGSATCGGMLCDFRMSEGVSFAGLFREKDYHNFKF